MRLHIEGGAPLLGTVSVPADKSMTHRALLFAALARGDSRIAALSPGQDILSTARVLRALGVRVEQDTSGFGVTGSPCSAWRAPAQALDCGNSGTTIRLVAGMLAGAGIEAQLAGDPSLSRRPMGRVCRPLRALGAAIDGQSVDGRELPPLSVRRGAYAGGSVALDIASAQVKSSLLLAGVCSGRATSVREPSASRDHTERLLAALGVSISTLRGKDGSVTASVPTEARVAPLSWQVPGDFSSAAFLLAAGVLVPGSKVGVQDVGVNPTRTGLLEVLEEYGARCTVTGWRLDLGEPVATVTAEAGALVATRAGGGPLLVDGATVPRIIDELVVLAALAAQAQGETVVRDAAELRVKESDRVRETVRLLAAFGIEAHEAPDGYRVRGRATLRPARINVSADHRLALTAAVLALAAPGESVLDGFEIAAVSYPSFVEALASLGARVRLTQE